MSLFSFCITKLLASSGLFLDGGVWSIHDLVVPLMSVSALGLGLSVTWAPVVPLSLCVVRCAHLVTQTGRLHRRRRRLHHVTVSQLGEHLLGPVQCAHVLI